MSNSCSSCSNCAFCANPAGPDPIEETIKKMGMAIVQLHDARVPPLYYSVGNSTDEHKGVEFLVAGLDPDCASGVIAQMVKLWKEDPKKFEKNGIVKDAITINKMGQSVKASAFIRAINISNYYAICGKIQDRNSEPVKVFQVFIPDGEGHSFDHKDYSPELKEIQCPFLSE